MLVGCVLPRLQWETLATVGRDVLQPARVSIKMGRKKSTLADFLQFFLIWLTLPLLWFSMQHLTQETTEVALLRRR
jgi:hypothetical protein